MRTRFAPSPSGHLHLGHLYSAHLASELARDLGGECSLRIEDIDQNRCSSSYEEDLKEDLNALGLQFQGPILRQSERYPHYEQALKKLQTASFTYPCFCSRKEIQEELKNLQNAPHGPEGKHYPGTCRDLDPKERTKRIQAGAEHCWRFHSERAASILPKLTFTDIHHGLIAADPTLLGDLIIARKDIGTSYHLAVVVDDFEQQITHVVRGDDLLASTHLHRYLQEILKFSAPIYLHHPLVCDPDGKRLAKRDQARSLRELFEAGWQPDQIWKLLAHMPHSEKLR